MTSTTRRAMLAGTAALPALAATPALAAVRAPRDPAADVIDAFKRLSPADLQRIKDGIVKANAADAAADPIFDAIAAHRKAMAACHAAVDVSARLRDDTPEHDAAQAITDRATDDLDEAGKNLAAIEPTSAAGLFAVLSHVIGCIEEADGDGLGGDLFDGGNWRLPHQVVVGDDGTEQHFALFFLRSIQRTLARLSVRGA
jgi:hypothetical protein